MRVVVAYAPGVGHNNTILPIWHELHAHPDCEVYLCGSSEVVRFIGKAIPPGHRPSGPTSYLRSGANLREDDIVGGMGRQSYRDISSVIDLVKPDLLICDTSERGAVVAAHAKKVPFVRVVSCADAATPAGVAAESRRLALIRGTTDDDPLASPLNWGTVAFGPSWFFNDSGQSETELRCFRFRPAQTTPTEPAGQSGTDPAGSRGPKGLISFGTFVREPSATTYCESIAGFLDAGLASVVVKVREPATRAEVRRRTEHHAEVTVTDDLDLPRRLPNAEVLLCHGSATSTLEALYYGVAPLIRPSHNDAFFVARQCARRRAAIVLDADVTRRDIQLAVEQALPQSGALLRGVAAFTTDNECLPTAKELVEQLRTADCTYGL